jgi:hypothetical protein
MTTDKSNNGPVDFAPSGSVTAQAPFAAPAGSARVSVRLKASDWETLVNFVQGDISNMDIADPNRADTEKILNAIRLALAKARNAELSRASDEPKS